MGRMKKGGGYFPQKLWLFYFQDIVVTSLLVKHKHQIVAGVSDVGGCFVLPTSRPELYQHNLVSSYSPSHLQTVQ